MSICHSERKSVFTQSPRRRGVEIELSFEAVFDVLQFFEMKYLSYPNDVLQLLE